MCRMWLSVFFTLILIGCGNSSQETSSNLLLTDRNYSCSVTADTLHSARQDYTAQCGRPPVDCDPIANHWMCSSEVIGTAAPGIRLAANSPEACLVTASTLPAAQQAYAASCLVNRVDCDPIGNYWMCSSMVIGANAPSSNPEAPTSEPSPIVPGLSVAAQWNELALAAVRSGKARPTVTTWQLFMVSTAMYDALAVYSPDSTPYALESGARRPASEFTEDNRTEAVSNAAYHMLVNVFPAYEQQHGFFKQYLHSLGYAPTRAEGMSPASMGYKAAIAVIDARMHDGANSANDFADISTLIYPNPYSPVNSPDPISETGLFGDDFDPNRWQPLRVPNGTVLDDEQLAVIDNLNINSFGDQTFLTPHWGGVTPFALSYGAVYRPEGPPLYGSDEPYVDALGVTSTNEEAYIRQITEVLDHSATLNDRQKVIAEFWADGPRTESPPGHWNQLSHGIIERDHLNLTQAVHLFFALNSALLDAGIATWEAKRHYDYIRPASAIRWHFTDVQVAAWGGPNKGAQTILGQNWSPYQSITFVTPPFPEYVSGHSTFSRAAAEVLTRFTGSGTFYDGFTTTLQDVNNDGKRDVLGEHIAPAGSFFIEEGPASDVVLQWETFIDAADEAGISRLYGGIHIQDGDLRGRELGRKVGISAFDEAMRYIHGF